MKQMTDSSQRRSPCRQRRRLVVDTSLQQVLWTGWTSLLLGYGYLDLRPALRTGAPVDILGLISSALLLGVLGLVVITLVEQRLEPWRFLLDDEERRS